jgi:dihydropteroate synthase
VNNRITDSDKKSRRFVLTGKALSVSAPCIMGVLNVTPDSFSDGGRFDSVKRAVSRIEKMVRDGASVIDIGGESTRPGSDPVAAEEEIRRVIPVIEKVVSEYPDTMFSIDTTKYTVAQ